MLCFTKGDKLLIVLFLVMFGWSLEQLIISFSGWRTFLSYITISLVFPLALRA